MKTLLQECRLWLGIERNTTSHSEKIISALGACVGILAVYWVTAWTSSNGYMTSPGNLLVIASMGASAVLLFAVPHGALSQPWAVAGGHLASALIGVTCQRLFPEEAWTGAAAVGLAVGAMVYLRCIHPPGGATALAAVIGGPEVEALGYYYLAMPVLVNVLAILATAVLFNSLFKWRRYPMHFSRRRHTTPSRPAQRHYELTQEDFAAAMQQLNSYVDVTAEGLTELLELAKQHAEKSIAHPSAIIAGHFYSNGKLGNEWSIRQVVDASSETKPSKDKVIYKTLAGDGAFETGLCLRDEFRYWARFEVIQQDGRWVKVNAD